MTQVRKTSGNTPPSGVIYDLAERRRQAESAAARAPEGTADAPEARADRVARLKAQIASGTYNPDPREIAKKILDSGF